MELKLIYFASPGCSICAHQTQILEQLQQDKNLNIEHHSITTSFDIALSFGVKSAPSLVFLLNSRPYKIKTGFQSKSEIENIISELKQL